MAVTASESGPSPASLTAVTVMVKLCAALVSTPPLAVPPSSLSVTDDVAFTTSIDVLEAVASGTGPQRMLVSIGYAGWSPGQLEEEIARNGWLTVGADLSVIFDTPIAERYERALSLLGLQSWMLSPDAGHA